MKKPGFVLGVFVTVCVALLICAVAYVSLLGENNKIDELVQGFFQDIRLGDYDAGLRPNAAGPHEDAADALFLLDLALYEHYGFPGRNDSEMVFKRNRLWVPFLSEGSVKVDVGLRHKPGKGFLNQASSLVGKAGSPTGETPLVEGLLTVARKHGSWVVASINVRGSAIERDYANLQERLRRERYLTRTEHGFAMKEFEARPAEMTFVEKQMLIHTLRKAQDWLGSPAGAEAKARGIALSGLAEVQVKGGWISRRSERAGESENHCAGRHAR